MIQVFKTTNRTNNNYNKVLVKSTKAVSRQQQVQVAIDKPLGLRLRQSKASGGGLEIASSTGNAAKAGLKSGDTIVFTSSFFGDELWPSDKLGFTQSALEACPSPAVIVYVEGSNETVKVKSLAPKPAPRRFGRKLTSKQKALASQICIDCGWIYCEETPFSQQPANFICPQCNASKKRFAGFDAISGKIYGAEGAQIGTFVTVIGGLVGRDNMQEIAELLLLQIFLREILQVPLRERGLRCHVDLRLVPPNGDLLAEISRLAANLDPVLEEALQLLRLHDVVVDRLTAIHDELEDLLLPLGGHLFLQALDAHGSGEAKALDATTRAYRGSP